METKSEVIATSASGFVRTVHVNGEFYRVEAQSIRAARKLGDLLFWKPVLGVYGEDKAAAAMKQYAGER